MVEALLICVQSYRPTSLEHTAGIGTILGVLVRLANAMGYHKDPGHVALLLGRKICASELGRYPWSWNCSPLSIWASRAAISIRRGHNTSSNYLTPEFDDDSVVLPTLMPRTEQLGLPIYVVKHI